MSCRRMMRTSPPVSRTPWMRIPRAKASSTSTGVMRCAAMWLTLLSSQSNRRPAYKCKYRLYLLQCRFCAGAASTAWMRAVEIHRRDRADGCLRRGKPELRGTKMRIRGTAGAPAGSDRHRANKSACFTQDTMAAVKTSRTTAMHCAPTPGSKAAIRFNAFRRRKDSMRSPPVSWMQVRFAAGCRNTSCFLKATLASFPA